MKICKDKNSHLPNVRDIFSKCHLRFLNTVSLLTSIVKLIASVAIIFTMLVRITTFSQRIYKLYKSKMIEKKRHVIWTSRPNLGIAFYLLPFEILEKIFLHMDNTSLCRLSVANSKLHLKAKDHALWVKRMVRDWPDYSSSSIKSRKERALKMSLTYYQNSKNIDQNAPERIQINSPGYLFYKQRFVAYARFVGEKCKNNENSISGILYSEASKSTEVLLSVIAIPFKLIGFLSFPLFWICMKRNHRLQQSSPSCLRRKKHNLIPVFVVDFTRLAERLQEYEKLHLFGATNLFLGFLLALDEVARALSWY
jgi:hypothetical protein